MSDLTTQPNATQGEFYSSGGLNDSTGREPFEDSTREYIPTGVHEHHNHASGGVHHHHSGATPGFGGLELGEGERGLNSSSHNTGSGVGNREFDGNAVATSGSKIAEIPINTSSHTTHTSHSTPPVVPAAVGAGVVGSGISHDHDSHAHRDIKSGTSAEHSGYLSSGQAGVGAAGVQQTGDAPGGTQTGSKQFGTGEDISSTLALLAKHTTESEREKEGTTGPGYNPVAGHEAEHHLAPGSLSGGGANNSGVDRSAGFSGHRESGLPGNQGITGREGGEGNGLSSGAANTDKFDVPASNTNTSSSYGQNIGDKVTTNQNPGRHGDDFTGGFAATGGAYTNENAKTGLTGRETTTTGVPDKAGNATQKTGLVSKVKGALGLGHKHDDVANASATQ